MRRILFMLMAIVLGMTQLVGCGTKSKSTESSEACKTASFVTEFETYQGFKADKINKRITVNTESEESDGKSQPYKTSKVSLNQVIDGTKRKAELKADASKSGDIKVKGNFATIVQDGTKAYIDIADAKDSIKDDKKLEAMFKIAKIKSGTVDMKVLLEKIDEKLDSVKYSKLDSVSKNTSYFMISALRLLFEAEVAVNAKGAIVEELEYAANEDKGVVMDGTSLKFSKKEFLKALDKVETKIEAGKIKDEFGIVEKLLSELDRIDENFDVEMNIDNSDKTSLLEIGIEKISAGKGFESDIRIAVIKEKSDAKVKVDIPDDSKDITKQLIMFIGAYIDREPVKDITKNGGSASNKYDDYEDYDDYDYDDDDDWDDDYDDDDYDDDDYDDDDYDDCDDDDGYEETQKANNSYYDKNVEE